MFSIFFLSIHLNFAVIFKIHPFIKVIKRKKCFDDADGQHVCNRECNLPPQTYQNVNQNQNDNNNNDIVSTLDNNYGNESDSVSLEILWQPQTGSTITADVVFVHGLHGKLH